MINNDKEKTYRKKHFILLNTNCFIFYFLVNLLKRLLNCAIGADSKLTSTFIYK